MCWDTEHQRAAAASACLSEIRPAACAKVHSDPGLGFVAPPQSLHDARDAAGVDRRHQQVYVVGHEHIGVDRTALAHRDLAKLAPISFVVDFREETRLAVVATLDDMLLHGRGRDVAVGA